MHSEKELVSFLFYCSPNINQAMGNLSRESTIRVFPKVDLDHSARSDRIVLVEYTTGSVVESNFC